MVKLMTAISNFRKMIIDLGGIIVVVNSYPKREIILDRKNLLNIKQGVGEGKLYANGPEAAGEVTEEVTRESGECSPSRLEEIELAVVKFPCPVCDRTFDLKIKLNRYLKLQCKGCGKMCMLSGKLSKLDSLASSGMVGHRVQ